MRAPRDRHAATRSARKLWVTSAVAVDDMAVTAAWLRHQLRMSRQRRRRTVVISLRTGDLIDAALRELIEIRREAPAAAGGSSRAS